MRYFIDWENVGPHGLMGAADLDKDDMIVIFFSDHSPKLPIVTLKELAATTAKVKWRFIEQTGSNALDFVIATEVGYAMAKNKKDDITIISKDNGYQSIALYWQKRDRKIVIREQISLKPETEKKTEEKAPADAPKTQKAKPIKPKKNGKMKIEKKDTKKMNRNQPHHHYHHQYHGKRNHMYHKQG